MSTSPSANSTEGFRLPDATHLSRVHLRTADLTGIVAFYEKVMGLQVVKRSETQASFSASSSTPEILVISQDENALPRGQSTIGLYHLAILYPSREELGNAVARVALARYPINGDSDHSLGESVYLNDPDGNGLELYYDRPGAKWPLRNGSIDGVSKPMDFNDLIDKAVRRPIPENAPPETQIGHINLHVADLQESERFFDEFLGLSVMARIPWRITFLAAGGYHHHVAVNTLAGKERLPENSVGLISYRLNVPNSDVLAALKTRAELYGYQAEYLGDILKIRDPNGHWLELKSNSSEIQA